MKPHIMAFIDLETTGLDPEWHEIIEVAVIIGNTTYCKKVLPEYIDHADPEALAINGYSACEWDKSAITQKQAAQELAELLENKVLVGHNIDFDISFLRVLFWNNDIAVPYHRRKVCTAILALEHLPSSSLRSLSMDSIREYMGWSKDKAHTALKDVQDARKLYMMLWASGHLKRMFIKIRAAFNRLYRGFYALVAKYKP